MTKAKELAEAYISNELNYTDYDFDRVKVYESKSVFSHWYVYFPYSYDALPSGSIILVDKITGECIGMPQ
jgi:hypothetical protein